MKKKIKTLLSLVAVLLVFAAVFALVQQLVTPKYMTDLVEGSMLSQYYREEKNHDAIFIGDCEVYANISPMTMWQERGITAYVRGSSQQLIWQSYYILEETLKYETPKVVVYNVNAMRYSEPVSEPYNRMTIDKLKWSSQKVNMIRASMMEEETFASYVFPILRYHSRFDSLTGEDIRYLFRVEDTTHNGHLINTHVEPYKALPAKRPLANYDFGQICWEYLEKMEALCREKGVELVLMKAPSLYPYWYDQYDAQITEFAQKKGLRFYNFTACTQEIGLDFSQDTYDGGLHLNLTGAEKFSAYFADILADSHGVPDRSAEEAIAALYGQKLEAYQQAKKGK